MAAKVRNLLNRNGRFFARLVIPKELRAFMDKKTELRTALGPDYRTALRKLPGAVALLQHQIALAERRAVAAGKQSVTIGRYPLAADQIALRSYYDRLAQDDAARNAGPVWASVEIDDGFVARLRRGIAGQLSDAELLALVGARIERFRLIGNTTALPGSDEWRALARAICISEYEALARIAERDDGDFTGTPSHPVLAKAKPEADPLPPVSLKRLFTDYVAAKKRVGKANPWTAAGQLRADLTGDALLHGGGFAQIVRVGDDEPFELQRLPPGSTRREFLDSGEPIFVISTKTGELRRSFRDVLYLPGFRDASPVALGREAAGFAMTLERTGSEFFGSGARASTVLTNDAAKGSDDPDSSGAKATRNLAASYKTWRENTDDEPLLLDAGWKLHQEAMASTDAQYIENRLEQVREIARMFGVPATLLYELSKGTYANTEQMAASFLTFCLRPWLNRWQDAYSTVLLNEDEQDEYFFEFVTADLERADVASRAESYSKLIAARVLTPNEVRSRENMPPHDDGDDLANPYTTTTGPAKVPAKE